MGTAAIYNASVVCHTFDYKLHTYFCLREVFHASIAPPSQDIMIEYLRESVLKAAAISSGPLLGKAKVDEKDVLFSLRKVCAGL